MRNTELLVTVGLLVSALPLYAAPARGKTVAPPPAVVSPVNIEFSHLLDEVRAERFEPLIERFNGQQKDVHITLVRRVAGASPKQLNLVTPDEQARFIAQKSRFKPLHEVMKAAKEPFEASRLSPELREGLTDAN